MPRLPHLYHRKKRERRAQWGRQSSNTKLCSGRATLLLRELLTYRKEWTKCLPANLSLLKTLRVWFIWKQSSVSLRVKNTLLKVDVSSDFIVPYTERQSYCTARLAQFLAWFLECTSTFSTMATAVGIDWLFQFPFQTTSATCVSSLEERILEMMVNKLRTGDADLCFYIKTVQDDDANLRF